MGTEWGRFTFDLDFSDKYSHVTILIITVIAKHQTCGELVELLEVKRLLLLYWINHIPTFQVFL
jgi:hypothetical protein